MRVISSLFFFCFRALAVSSRSLNSKLSSKVCFSKRRCALSNFSFSSSRCWFRILPFCRNKKLSRNRWRFYDRTIGTCWSFRPSGILLWLRKRLVHFDKFFDGDRKVGRNFEENLGSRSCVCCAKASCMPRHSRRRTRFAVVNRETFLARLTQLLRRIFQKFSKISESFYKNFIFVR